MKRLVVTADDFGISREVNEAVEAAHREGVLTAASLMITGPAVDDAIARARRMPRLRVGLHLDLLEGIPVSPPAAVRSIADESGRLRDRPALTGMAMILSPRVRREVETEIIAQLSAYRALGLPLDHVNAHKHFHIHPLIIGILARIGHTFGVRAVRVPVEPHHVLTGMEDSRRGPMERTIDLLAQRAKRRLAKADIAAPDAVFGLRWSGAMTEKRLCWLIENLPDGVNEIYCHPATTSGFAGSAASYRYPEELAALVASATHEAVRREHVQLGGFSDFVQPDTLVRSASTERATAA